jgi:hypothetical protein
MSSQDSVLFNKITEGIKLAVAIAMEKIKNSPYPTNAVSRYGKNIVFINLKDSSIK